MTVTDLTPAEGPLPSPSGPIEDTDGTWTLPPAPPLSPLAQTVRFGVRPLGFSFKSRNALGEVFRIRLVSREESIVVTSHPDHVKALFTAKRDEDRKSTRLNSSHPSISYAVFCLKKKKKGQALHATVRCN